MPINYSQKINERPLGQEVLISNENHTVGIVGVATVLANMVKLVEVPSPNYSVVVPGYSITTNPTPGNGFFYVDYVNGYLTFNPSANGNSVQVTYHGRGSEIDAVDINEVQEPLSVFADLDGTLTPTAIIYEVLTVNNPASITTSDVDNYTGLVVVATISTTLTMPSPTNTSTGRFFTILNRTTSTQDITINWSNPGINSINIAIGSGASFLWDGLAWVLVAGGGGGFPVFSSDPSTPFLGQTYFNSTSSQFLGYNGSVWVVLG